MRNSKIFIFDILVHITFLFTILFLFFFLVGLKKEREALISNIQSNTEKLISSNQQIQNLRNTYDNLEPQNKKIFKKNLIKHVDNSKFTTGNQNNLFLALGIVILIGLVSITTYYGFYIHNNGVGKNKLIEIVYNTLILFVIICTIEVVFFFLVIMKYQPILNSDINKTFVDKYNEGLPSLIKNMVKQTNNSKVKLQPKVQRWNPQIQNQNLNNTYGGVW